MGSIHVYTARDQPATNHVYELGGKRFRTRIKKLAMLPCHRCRKKHRAMNMIAHVYYDGTYFFGKHCRG